MFIQLKTQFAYVKIKEQFCIDTGNNGDILTQQKNIFFAFNLRDIKVHKNKRNLLLSAYYCVHIGSAAVKNTTFF